MEDYAAQILPVALWRFTLHGLPSTTTAEIARLAHVGVGTLFRTFPTKEALLDATYAYAVTQLTAPLQAGVGDAQRGESLQQLLSRWWSLTAQAALAQPEAFDMWRLYRTRPRSVAPLEPLLGPFAAVPTLVEQALARRPATQGVPLSVLSASLAAQWTAAVDLVLSDAQCRAQAALTTQVLAQAYTGWWQGLGLPTYLDAAWQTAPAVASRPKPVPEPPAWLKLVAHALTPPAPAPIPALLVTPPLKLGSVRPLVPQPPAQAPGPPPSDEPAA